MNTAARTEETCGCVGREDLRAQAKLPVIHFDCARQRVYDFLRVLDHSQIKLIRESGFAIQVAVSDFGLEHRRTQTRATEVLVGCVGGGDPRAQAKSLARGGEFDVSSTSEVERALSD